MNHLAIFGVPFCNAGEHQHKQSERSEFSFVAAASIPFPKKSNSTGDFPFSKKMAEKESEQMDEERQIGEEYRNWKKNTPFLYDLVSESRLG